MFLLLLCTYVAAGVVVVDVVTAVVPALLSFVLLRMSVFVLHAKSPPKRVTDIPTHPNAAENRSAPLQHVLRPHQKHVCTVGIGRGTVMPMRSRLVPSI